MQTLTGLRLDFKIFLRVLCLLTFGVAPAQIRRELIRLVRNNSTEERRGAVIMEIRRRNGTLSVRGLREIRDGHARLLRDRVCTQLRPGLNQIEIDLSETNYVNSSGLAALVSIYKTARKFNHEGVTLRLLNPRPEVQQLFELTRMHRLFEIVSCYEPEWWQETRTEPCVLTQGPEEEPSNKRPVSLTFPSPAQQSSPPSSIPPAGCLR